jgi:DNA-binding XRE family transcriptional regulator
VNKNNNRERRIFMGFFERKWRLCACRVNAGYTQVEVANMLGVVEATVINWETGKHAVRMDVAQRLSELYQVPIAYIDFTREGNRIPLKDRAD